MSGDRARSRPNVVLAALLAMAVAGAASCRPAPTVDREVAVRVSDLLYRPIATTSFTSTANDPSRTFENDRRSVLIAPGGGGTEIRVEIDLSRGSRVDFAFAADDDVVGLARLSLAIEMGRGTETAWESTVGDAEHPPGRWHDVRVELGDREGRATLTWSVVHESGPSGSSAGVYFSDAVITRPARAALPRSLVLVSLDTLRADRLGIYGYDRPVSPTIDAMFGSEGVVVERHLANASDTLFGHTAMFSGEQPMVSLLAAERGRRAQAPWLLTIADLMRTHGYRTAAFTENAYVGAIFGFARGFESYYELTDIEHEMRAVGHAARTFQAAAEWIDEHRHEPFFVFVHTYEVHNPYHPPPEQRARFAPGPFDSPVQRDSDLYDAEIAYTDVELGKFVDRLRAMRTLDRSLLVVTSDHGEEFGEQGGRYHGAQLHDPILHVPLLMRAPGLLPAGARRGAAMAQIDLMPTLLDLLEVPRPLDVTGRSLAEHIVGGAPVEPVAVISEARGQKFISVEGHVPGWLPPAFAATRGKWRLIRLRTPDGPRYELFDLERDPMEQSNVYAEHATEVTELRELLDSYRTTSLRRRGQLARTGAVDTVAPPRPELDDVRRRKLEALGYLDPAEAD